MRFRVTAIALLVIFVAAAVLTSNRPAGQAAATVGPAKTVADPVIIVSRSDATCRQKQDDTVAERCRALTR